jgi:hypothetical protein
MQNLYDFVSNLNGFVSLILIDFAAPTELEKIRNYTYFLEGGLQRDDVRDF